MIRDEYRKQLVETRAGWEGWGSSAVRNAGPEIVRWLNKQKAIKTVLDFGCGTGTLGKFIAEEQRRGYLRSDIVWSEYDPSVPGKDAIPDGEYDAIVSVDVLEHIEPASLAGTLDWIRQRSRRQYHHIDCNATEGRLPDGRAIHLIVRPPEWWRDTLVVPGWWTLMEYHEHHKRKRGRYPRTSTTIIVERG